MWGKALVAIDSIRGYLLEVDCNNDNTRILNPRHVNEFIGTTGLAIAGDTLWMTRGDSVYTCDLAELEPRHFATLPYPANGVAIWGSTLYVSCQKTGYIFVFSCKTGEEITRFYAPGVGIENLTVRGEQLWVCDTVEQSIYCMDRATGSINYSLLAPFESPTGLVFYPHPETEEPMLYVAYASEEPYIRDNPNSANPFQLTFRDRTFLHPLHIHYHPEQHYAVSNSYLIEMSYVEELSPLDPLLLENLEWHICLPADSLRQTVKHVEPIGLPFVEQEREGQRVAVFKFDRLDPHEAHVFGWKALLEVRSIKYNLTPPDIDDSLELPPGFAQRYLVDNDNLAMDTDIVRRAARNAVDGETNLLRKVIAIRDYAYDRLEYGIKPHIDPPDIVLERGIGSCGEYVGILLALLRLNGIACRTVGRYKCPARAEQRRIPLQPDFNHVWLEFYVPGFGWVPMESNPDGTNTRGPYPTRFFMGLAWYHIEINKSVRFETLFKDGAPVNKEQLSIGDLALNHVRFEIVEELPPSPSVEETDAKMDLSSSTTG